MLKNETIMFNIEEVTLLVKLICLFLIPMLFITCEAVSYHRKLVETIIHTIDYVL